MTTRCRSREVSVTSTLAGLRKYIMYICGLLAFGDILALVCPAMGSVNVCLHVCSANILLGAHRVLCGLRAPDD